MATHPERGEEDLTPTGESSQAQAGSNDELHRLMHDLKTHQIELTQQNRELRDAQIDLEVSRDHYARLYDRAPVGYCTLDRSGIIREINLTGASMLGNERGRLTGIPLWSHLDAGPRGEIALTVSIGISVYPDDGIEAEDLVRQADTAMYMAKQDGRNTFRFYAADLTKQAFDRILLRSGLAHAVERGELLLLYQPQLALDMRRVPGIDSRVLRTACTQRKRWQSEGLDEGTLIKINLSRRALERPGFADDLGAMLRELDLDARLVGLELTETGFISDSPAALDTVQRLKRLGVELSIDHFGAFSSSFADLKRLPVGELKMDKSLIDGLPENTDDAAITRTILALGKTLGMRVIAQGVETQDQADFLQKAGCKIAQGFLYTQPLGPDELMRFAKTWT